MMHVAHLTAHSYIGAGSHMAVYPPVPTAVLTMHIAMDTLLGLTIGAKWSKTVIGPFGFQFIGAGNDSGFVVPHIAVPPPNVLIPVIIGFGGSKPMFSASTVLIDVDGAGLPMSAVAIPYNFVSINQACNDPCNYPSDMVISPNTVVVGLTLGDYVAGVANIAIDCIISAFANKVGGGVAEGIMNKIGGRIVAAAFSRFGGKLAQGFAREGTEKVIQETIGKLTEGQVGNLIDYDLAGADLPKSGDVGGVLGQAVDGPANAPVDGANSTSEANTGPYPGAAPIHNAH